MNLRSLVLTALLFPTAALPGAEPPVPAKPVSVNVTRGETPRITLAASEVPLSIVAAEVGKALNAAFTVSSRAATIPVSIKADDEPVELVLRQLAPQVFIDGVAIGSLRRSIMTVHYRDAGEAPPSADPLRRSTTQVFGVAGHTEDDAKPNPLEDAVSVAYKDGRLTVRARQQPLLVVVYEIAEAMKLPFDLGGDIVEPVDLNMKDSSVLDVIAALPSYVSLHYRQNLTTFAVEPLRIELAAAKAAPRK